MSLSFDDKILGEKVDNYCSSSDDDAESEESSLEESDVVEPCVPPQPVNTLSHQVAQTGPKGVIADYKQYRKLKLEQEELAGRIAMQVAKKCALTARPYSADQAAKEQDQQMEEICENLVDDDAFLAQYREKRLAELQGTIEKLPVYRRVYELNANNFVSEVDKEPAQVTSIVHIYREGCPACKSTNEAFEYLCKAYPHSKFSRLRASTAFLSRNFVVNGVPAILVYKNKELIGNLISINKELDDYFTPEELEVYLFDASPSDRHGFLPPKETAVPASLTYQSVRRAPVESDSD